jgi:alcohol dehydrogenase (cytochrome c)
LFVGGREGNFFALNARDGTLLWKAALGGNIASGPISYSVNGRQYIGVAAGNSLFTFALRQ